MYSRICAVLTLVAALMVTVAGCEPSQPPATDSNVTVTE